MTQIQMISGTNGQALSLWTGSANSAEPPGWQTLAFDDALWPTARNPLENPGYPDITGAVGMWASDVPQAVGEDCLFRQHLTVPAGTVTAMTLVIEADDSLVAVYFNGHAIPVNTALDIPAQTITIDPALARAGYDNVLAVRGHNGPPGSGTGVGFAAVAYILSVDYTGGVGTAGGSGGQEFTGGALTDALRARHRTGVVMWEHDGTTFRLSSAGKGVLQTPFPVMAGQPAALLGQDALTGLPMWTGTDAPPPPPPPPPVSVTYPLHDQSLEDTHLAPDPLPVPPSAERVCGAADNMAAVLCEIYNAVVQVVNAVRSRVLTTFTQALKQDIQAQIVSLLTEGEFGQFEIDAVQLGLNILAALVETLLSWGTRLPTIAVPTPGDTGVGQFIKLRCAAWQALWLTGGDYLSESKSADGLGTRDYWQQNLAPQWSFFAGSTIPGISESNPPWQLRWLTEIIAATPDAGWVRAAWFGAQRPLTTCTGCPGYPP